ncbi:NAD(P)-dependent oxidoreductase [Gryllotalpicola reticulitermitis]|uniref:NAD(P)-dependent oxidoreductase n=1 Tax=Gryllotalpicola reticulitermitis TaxID=1184153 RepID=A0ABV8Q093_9MICO
MSNITVFGVTGYVGGAITAEARSRGHHVLGVARDTSAIQEGEGLTLRSGSIFDAAFVETAVQGADVVAIALPGAPGEHGGLADAIPAILEAMQKAGARLGIVGGAGSLLAAEGGPRLIEVFEPPAELKAEIAGTAAVLERLRATDTPVDWFYLMPPTEFGAHVPGTRTGKFRVGGEVLLKDDAGESKISGADFAIAFVDEIEKPAHQQSRFTVAY